VVAAAAVQEEQQQQPEQQPAVEERSVTLRKPVGVVFAQDKGGPVFVEELTPGGNADKSGIVQVRVCTWRHVQQLAQWCRQFADVSAYCCWCGDRRGQGMCCVCCPAGRGRADKVQCNCVEGRQGECDEQACHAGAAAVVADSRQAASSCQHKPA
jgi:hypothetical protein